MIQHVGDLCGLSRRRGSTRVAPPLPNVSDDPFYPNLKLEEPDRRTGRKNTRAPYFRIPAVVTVQPKWFDWLTILSLSKDRSHF